jgi:hypothetical protein
MVGMHGNLKGRQKGTPQYAQYSVARLVGTEDLKVSANVLGKCSRIIENSRINGASRYKYSTSRIKTTLILLSVKLERILSLLILLTI